LAGVDFSNMSGSDFDGLGSLSSRTGFIGGLFAAVPMGSGAFVEPEVLYAMKGTKLDSLGISLDMSYIEVPVLFKYKFVPAGGPYIIAGPAIGFSVSCNESAGSVSLSCSDDGLVTNTTFAGIVGLGFQQGRVGIEGRYDFDFGSTFKNVDVKNHAWEIMARLGIN